MLSLAVLRWRNNRIRISRTAVVLADPNAAAAAAAQTQNKASIPPLHTINDRTMHQPTAHPDQMCQARPGSLPCGRLTRQQEASQLTHAAFRSFWCARRRLLGSGLEAKTRPGSPRTCLR